MSTRRRPRGSANTRFWDVVGEPRGLEYTAVPGSRDWLYTVFDIQGFTRPFDWVLLSL